MASTYPLPTRRPLNVYAMDPQAGDSPGNKVTIDIPFERLCRGPSGSVVEVIDYDYSQKTNYEPVDLDRLETLICGGLSHEEADPRFHQQMVYAVSMRVIENFASSLGRPVRFSQPGKGYQPLRIIPHAFEQANAFFDPELHAVLFGYFIASETNPGRNLPGQTVFTCLSHDIIAHEITHAILHRLRRYFIYPTNIDALAFHEGFSDIVAIFQRLTYREVVEAHISNFRGNLTNGNLGDLAAQFGAALGTNAALRSAIDERPPDATRLEQTYEAHTRGAILLAAVFDTFVRVYERRSADLMRIATGGSGVLPEGRLHPDLVGRLTSEALKAAQSLLNMCIRAIDYLPPVDVTFSDFLRAIVTADSELVQEDKLGQRGMLIEAFRQRGIYPKSVMSLAPESVRWDRAPEGFPPLPREVVKNFWMTMSMQSAVERERKVMGRSQEMAEKIMEYQSVIDSEEQEEFDPKTAVRGEDRDAKRAIAKSLWHYAKRNTKLLGLNAKLDIGVHGFHPNIRIAPDGSWRAEFVVAFAQEYKPKTGHDLGGMPLVGGTTVIADAEGNVRYVIAKPLPGAADAGFAEFGRKRLDDQAAFVAALDARDPLFSWGGQHYLTNRMHRRATFRALHGLHPAHDLEG